MELTTGVYDFPQTIQRGDTENTIHPAAVETSKGVFLIDAGYEGMGEQIEQNLSSAGFGWDHVRGVVITHHDGDHAGALSEIVERSDALVYAHPKAAPYIDGRDHPMKSGDDDRYPPVAVDVEIVDGVSFKTEAGPMTVLHTPGHTPDHLSLYLPERRLLIAADALTAGEGGLDGPSERYTLDMDEALESAGRFLELDVDRTLCHHGGLVEEGTERIGTIVESGP